METPKPYAIYPIGKKYAGWLIEDIPQSYGQWALSAFTSIRPDLLVTLKAIAGAS
jgi:hypothetical protein